ncbi:MAG: hypothetical protein ACFFEA_14085 [Candidatus Thorarchaeota archaeon]
MSLVKRLGVVALVLTFTIALVSVSPVQAKRQIFGTMDLEFNLGWPGYGTEIPDWVGTIEINGETYGMLFFAFWTGKPFDDPAKGMAFFFGEIWAIYDMDVASFPGIPNGDTGEWAQLLPANNPDGLVVWGHDEGVTNMANTKYHMTGSVEYAGDPFTKWAGRNVYMSGLIEWYEDIPAPHYAPGEFRINSP